MNSNKELIEKKLVLAAEIINSEEFKKADVLLKKLTKLKDEVKEYCQKNDLKEMVVEKDSKKYKVEYKVKNMTRADPKLLEPEQLEKITVAMAIWYQFFEIEEKK